MKNKYIFHTHARNFSSRSEKYRCQNGSQYIGSTRFVPNRLTDRRTEVKQKLVKFSTCLIQRTHMIYNEIEKKFNGHIIQMFGIPETLRSEHVPCRTLNNYNIVNRR